MRSGAKRVVRLAVARRETSATGLVRLAATGRWALAASVSAGLAVALAACTSLSDQAPPGISLAGTWRLDPQLSTNTHSALQSLVRSQHGKPPSGQDSDTTVASSGDDSGTGGGPEGGGGTQGGGTQGNGGRRHRSQSAFPEGDEASGIPIDTTLQRSLLSGGDYLKIEQRPDEFIVSNGDTTDSYVPGEKSVVSVPSGVADQHTGWKGKEYWVEIQPQVGPSATEKFRLSDDGKQLIETISVGSEGRVRKLDVTRVYERTTAIPIALPAGN